MRVWEVFPTYRGPGRDYPMQRALTAPESRGKVRAVVLMACVAKQRQVLRHLFPAETVDWHEETNEGRVPQWLNKV
jgi:hypothetical protein